MIKSELRSSPVMGDIVLDGFKINTTLDGLIDDDGIVGDENGIMLAISIPKVRPTIGSGNSLGELYQIISGGESKDLRVDINAPLVGGLVNPIFIPMMNAMNSLTGALTMAAMNTNSEGIGLQQNTDIPNIDSPLDIYLHLILPNGILLEQLPSANSDITADIVNGRQVIEYTMISGESDTLNYNLVIAWQWILTQLLPYIIAVLLFFAWRIRGASKKRKKRKRAAEIKLIENEASTNKFMPSVSTDPTIEVVRISNCNIVIKKRVSG